MKIPTHLWYKLRLLPEISFCLRVSLLPASACVRPCVNHEFVSMITRDPFKLRSPNLDQRYKTTWLCISLSKSPHSNYMYIQFLPLNSLRLRDG